MIARNLTDAVLAEAAASPSPTRAQVRRSTWLAASAAVVCSAGAFLVAGGVRPTGRPDALLAATAALSALVALVAVGAAMTRPASPDGRTRAALLAVVLGVPAALFAGKLLLSASWPGMTVWWSDRVGLRCLGLAMTVGAAPLVAALWSWRWRVVARPALTGAALGVASGACAWLLVDLWCPVGNPQHVALGHVLPLALLAAAGALARVWRRS